MTFDHGFNYYFPLFSSLLKKGKKKGRMNIKNRDQKSCLSVRSFMHVCIISKKIDICYNYFIAIHSLFIKKKFNAFLCLFIENSVLLEYNYYSLIIP